MTTAFYEAGTTTRGRGPCSLIAAWIRRHLRAQRMRAELNGLTDVELKDIGLSRCQIARWRTGRSCADWRENFLYFSRCGVNS